MFQSDGPVYVRRRQAEDLLDQCVVPTVKSYGGGIIVWGAMSYRGTGIRKYVKATLKPVGYLDILTNCAIPFAHLLGYGNDFFFQDDGAPFHRAKIVKD